jgi:hypothetical protein
MSLRNANDAGDRDHTVTARQLPLAYTRITPIIVGELRIFWPQGPVAAVVAPVHGGGLGAMVEDPWRRLQTRGGTWVLGEGAVAVFGQSGQVRAQATRSLPQSAAVNQFCNGFSRPLGEHFRSAMPPEPIAPAPIAISAHNRACGRMLSTVRRTESSRG